MATGRVCNLNSKTTQRKHKAETRRQRQRKKIAFFSFLTFAISSTIWERVFLLHRVVHSLGWSSSSFVCFPYHPFKNARHNVDIDTECIEEKNCMQGRSRFCWVRACMLALYSIFLALYTHTAREKCNNNFFSQSHKHSATLSNYFCLSAVISWALVHGFKLRLSCAASAVCIFPQELSSPSLLCSCACAHAVEWDVWRQLVYIQTSSFIGKCFFQHNRSHSAACIMCRLVFYFKWNPSTCVWAPQVCKHPKIVPWKSNLRGFEKAQNPEEKPRNRLKKSFAAIYKRLKKAQNDYCLCSTSQTRRLWNSLRDHEIKVQVDRVYWIWIHLDISDMFLTRAERFWGRWKWENDQIAHSSAHFSSISF